MSLGAEYDRIVCERNVLVEIISDASEAIHVSVAALRGFHMDAEANKLEDVIYAFEQALAKMMARREQQTPPIESLDV